MEKPNAWAVEARAISLMMHGKLLRQIDDYVDDL